MIPPDGAFWVLCPACRRIDESYPAGTVTLSGQRLGMQRTAILDLIHNEEIAERDEHALSRLMALVDHGGSIEATTTDTNLAQRIGEALRRAFGGELEVRYSDDDLQVSVRWEG
jgi:hypothetical protein